MAILDFEDTYKPPFHPKARGRVLSEEERLSELNDLGRKEVTQDFGDSPFANRKPGVE